MHYPIRAISFIFVMIQFSSVHVNIVNGACAFDPCSWGYDYCINGGTCSINETSCVAVCACATGYDGSRCETAIVAVSNSSLSSSTSSTLSVTNPAVSRCVFNPCNVIDYCLNNGTCSLEESTCAVRCTCQDSFTGSRCQDSATLNVTTPTTTIKVTQTCAFNMCSSSFNLCQNGGTCILDNTTCAFSCACPDGYKGSRCGINDNERETTTVEAAFCTFNPCVGISQFCYNNGSCSIDKNTCVAKCKCNDGFYGNRCEYDKDDTTIKPTTTDTGRTCAFNPCTWSSNYCKNSGECKLNKHTCMAYCTCSEGYSGDRCENIVGTGPTTLAPATTSERVCAFDICSWSSTFCQNGGTCYLDKSSCMTRCLCLAGFSGSRCEYRTATTAISTTTDGEIVGTTTQCSVNPCDETLTCPGDATCIQDQTTCVATCTCPDGYTGLRCDVTTTGQPTTTVTTTEAAVQAYNVCRGGALERGVEERQCRTSVEINCTYGVCNTTLRSKGLTRWYEYKCVCDPGAQGTFCDKKCCLDCGPHGRCLVYTTLDDEEVTTCECDDGFYGNRCEYDKDDTTIKPTTTDTGRTCAFNPCTWSSNYCKNSGECKLNKHTCMAYCTCSEGYSGDRCENIVGTGPTTLAPATTSERVCAFDICSWSSTFCQNGGTCYLDKSSCMTRCLCLAGFSGSRCEYRTATTAISTTTDGEIVGTTTQCSVNPCDETLTCPGDATCIQDQTTCVATCTCPDGYTGLRCDVTTTGQPTTTVTTTEAAVQAYNVCRGGALERGVEERQCRTSVEINCTYGVCNTTLLSKGLTRWYEYKCVCDPGAQGTFCEKKCCLDCGPHGRCLVYTTLDDEEVTTCECDHRWQGEYCDTYVPLPVRVEFEENTWYLWVVGVCVGTFLLLLLLAVATPYWMWKHRVILIMKIVHYFQAYEDDDEKEWDAFVSYKGDATDERFVVQDLYPKLEKELGFRLCLHFRDFVPGETISNNIINAVEGSRRTILILSPRYIKSEFTRFEYQKAQEEMLKRKHRIIPIVLEDISECKPVMDKNLKGIIDSVTYLEWPDMDSDYTKTEKFWKRLRLSMPKKKATESISSEKSYGSAHTSSTHVNSNIYSDGYNSDSQNVYMEIGEIDENMSTIIRPLSEKEEIELINSTKYGSAKDVVREKAKSDNEKFHNVKNLNSNFKNDIMFNIDDLAINWTDEVKTRCDDIIDLDDVDPVKCTEYIV